MVIAKQSCVNTDKPPRSAISKSLLWYSDSHLGIGGAFRRFTESALQ